MERDAVSHVNTKKQYGIYVSPYPNISIFVHLPFKTHYNDDEQHNIDEIVYIENFFDAIILAPPLLSKERVLANVLFGMTYTYWPIYFYFWRTGCWKLLVRHDIEQPIDDELYGVDIKYSSTINKKLLCYCKQKFFRMIAVKSCDGDKIDINVILNEKKSVKS